MTHKFKVRKLGLGQTTGEGAYWAEVDGHKVGMDGRAFWNTRSEAVACARRYILAIDNIELRNSLTSIH